MNGFADFLTRVLRGVLKLALVLAAGVFVLSFLLAAIVVVLGVSLWSLLTGRKPAPVVMFSRMRQNSQRYAQGVWPGRGERATGDDVVDVQATEVPDAPLAPPGAGDARKGPDTMSRVPL
ncbi:hypothetical protein D9M69_564210 [compost metagenome]